VQGTSGVGGSSVGGVGRVGFWRDCL